jgi:electron transfer flavoprotein beta subunit
MMSIAQKVPFELVAVDGSASGFVDSSEVAGALAAAIQGLAGLDRSKLLVFGGMASASRDSSTTMQMLGEKLGIKNQFVGVDEFKAESDGSYSILERVEGGQYQISSLKTLPAVVAWATGSLHEPPNNPQVGMQNMRTVMPALQRAQSVKFTGAAISYKSMELPKQTRSTRIVKDTPVQSIAKEIVDWIRS